MIYKVMLCALFMTAGLAAVAQPPKGKASLNATYGAGATAAGAVDAAKLPVLLKNESAEVPVKIKAQVLDVCPKKGCWMKLKVNDSTTAFVKMKNYGFFVPLDIKGKTIVLDGVAYQHTTSVDELQHYAKDAGKPQEAIDAITQPKREIRYTASGIRVVE